MGWAGGRHLLLGGEKLWELGGEKPLERGEADRSKPWILRIVGGDK